VAAVARLVDKIGKADARCCQVSLEGKIQGVKTGSQCDILIS